ncbi:MAG: HEPN domain-containing protein [Verrucomicrobiota bacterium]
MKPLVREWIKKAEEDFVAAQQLSRVRKPPVWNIVCFHCQQCVEKYLIAYLQGEVDVKRKWNETGGIDMKAIIILAVGLLVIGSAQVGLPTKALAAAGSSISADGSAPNDNAMLDVRSPATGDGKGMLIPRVTEAQRTTASASLAGGLLDNSGNLRGGAAQGLIVYQSDGAQGLYFNTSSSAAPAWDYYLPVSGGTMSGALNMGGQVVTNVAHIDFDGEYVAVGWSANGSFFGAAVGYEANGYNCGAAMGWAANGSSDGSAVGLFANGKNYGAAMAYSAKGYDFGAGIGYAANGSSFGVAVGRSANGAQTNVAIGYQANALGGTERIAIGHNVNNDSNNTARIRGTLHLDGGSSNIYYRTTFGEGGWSVKAFTIDHPLDPANKVLRHYCLEGPQVWNVYAGNVQLVNGQAIVQLPDYYSALNLVGSEIYSLTPVGEALVWIDGEVSDNCFLIAGKRDIKVSWTIKVLRNDPGCLEDLRRRPVEEWKR